MIVDASREPAISHTVPLFTRDTRAQPVLLGTSVLAEFERGIFLLTARHVVEDDSMGLFYPTPEGLVGLEATLTFPSVTHSGNHTSQIDIALVTVRRPPPEGLVRQFTPFDLEQPETVVDPEAGMSCIIVGYPATRTTRGGGTISSIPLCINTEIVDAGDRSPLGEFAVQFTRDRKKGVVDRFAPEPYGMSGCGAWSHGAAGRLRLIGIATTYERAPRNRILCASLSALFSA